MNKLKFVIISAFLILCFTGDVYSQKLKGADDFRVGQILFEDGSYLISADQMSSFIRNNPDDERCSQAQFIIGEAFYNLKDYDKALQAFRRYTIQYHTSPQYGEAWLNIADCYNAKKEYERAAETYMAAARSIFDDGQFAPEALHKSALIYNDLGLTEKAYETLAVLIDNYKNSQFYYPSIILVAKIYGEKREYIKAIRELTRIERSNADERNKWIASLQIAEYYFKLKNNNRAEQILRDLVSNVEKTHNIYFDASLKLAKYLRKFDNNQEAESILRNCLNETGISDYTKGKVLLELGVLSYSTEKYEDAAAQLSEAVSLLGEYPELRKANYYKAKNLSAIGSNDEPYRILSSMFTSNWFNEETDVRDFEADAFKEFLNVSSLNNAPVDINLFSNRAVTFSEKFKTTSQFADWAEVFSRYGKFGASARILEKGVSKFSEQQGCDIILVELGKVYETADQNIEAANTYRRIIQEYPGGESAEKAEERFNYLSRKYSMQNQTDLLSDKNALYDILYSRSSSLSSDDALKAGEYYYKKERDYEKGADYLKLILDKGENDPVYPAALKLAAGLYDDLYFISIVDQNTNIAEPAKQQATMFLRQYLRLYPGDIFSLNAIDKLMDMSIEDSFSPEDKLNSGLRVINEVDSSPGDLLETYLEYKRIELQILYSSENDSVLTAFTRIEDISYTDFPDDLRKKAYKILLTKAYDQGLFTNSVMYASKYMSEFPRGTGAAWIRYVGAYSLNKTGDTVAAKTWAENLMSDFFYSKYSFLGNAVIGDIYIEFGRYEEAKEFLKNALVRLSDTEGNEDILREVLWNIGKAEEADNNYVDSEDYYRTYISMLNSENEIAEGKIALAVLLEKAAKYNEAVLELQEATEFGEDSLVVLQAKEKEANILLKRVQDHKTAAVKFKELASLELADSSLIRYEYSYLVSLYRDDLRTRANDERRQFERRFRGLPEDLLDGYIALLKVEEGNVHLRNFQLDQDRFENAEKIFRDVIKDYPGTNALQMAELYLGQALMMQNKIEEGMPLLREFDMRHPDSPFLYDNYNMLGTVQKNNRQYPDAYVAFSKALTTAQGAQDTSLYRKYIETARISGFDDPALTAIRTYLKKFPNVPDRMNKLMDISEILQEQGRFDEALAHSKKIILEADPEQEMDIQLTISSIYFEQKKYTLAIAELTKLLTFGLESHPRIPVFFSTVKRILALCYKEIGNYDTAIKYLDEIIRAEGESSGFGRTAMRIKRDIMVLAGRRDGS